MSLDVIVILVVVLWIVAVIAFGFAADRLLARERCWRVTRMKEDAAVSDFVSGRIEVEELERRLDVALRAEAVAPPRPRADDLTRVTQ